MKQQKLVQIRLDELDFYECMELPLQKYLEEGWVISSYQVCPESAADNAGPFPGNVVVLLEKEQ